MLLMMLIMLLPVLLIPLFFVTPLWFALLVYVTGSALAFVYHRAMMTASRMPVVTGVRGMVGRVAEVVRWENDHGEVRCRGELWEARRTGTAPSPDRGSLVKVVGSEGLALVVEPASTTRDESARL